MACSGFMQTTLKVRAHNDDVNAVAFMDDNSNVVFSGSDDTELKVRKDCHCYN